MKKRDVSTQERRALIVEAAARCFIEKGFHQASIRDIASTAGISLGNLYNHFAGKEALIAEFAVMEARSIEAIRQSVGSERDPTEALERFAMQYFDSARDPANAALTLELTAESLRNPEIELQFSSNRQTLLGLLQSILSDGRKAGVFSNDVPLVTEANTIMDVIEGVAFRSAFSGKPIKPAVGKGLLATIRKLLSSSK